LRLPLDRDAQRQDCLQFTTLILLSIELHSAATPLLRSKSLLSEPVTPYIGLWSNTQNPNLNCDRRIGWRHHTRVLSTSRIGCLLISFFQNPEQKPGPWTA